MNTSNRNIDQLTLMEKVRKVTPGFPYMTQMCYMHNLPERVFPWHWHGEAELFYMVKGTLQYHVSGEVHTFHEGEAGFINANVLHKTYGLGEEQVLQQVHIFLPSFISGMPGSDIETKYVNPIVQGRGLELVRFQKPKKVIDLMHRASECYLKKADGFELRVRGLMAEIWMILYEETCGISSAASIRNTDNERLKAMLSYIAEHFAEKISLADIAAAGFVGERECFRIFRKNLDMTPLECLVSQRIDYACELLRVTDMSILDIALATGFSSGSYFGKVFRERLGVTPREYRVNT